MPSSIPSVTSTSWSLCCLRTWWTSCSANTSRRSRYAAHTHTHTHVDAPVEYKLGVHVLFSVSHTCRQLCAALSPRPSLPAGSGRRPRTRVHVLSVKSADGGFFFLRWRFTHSGIFATSNANRVLPELRASDEYASSQSALLSVSWEV